MTPTPSIEADTLRDVLDGVRKLEYEIDQTRELSVSYKDTQYYPSTVKYPGTIITLRPGRGVKHGYWMIIYPSSGIILLSWGDHVQYFSSKRFPVDITLAKKNFLKLVLSGEGIYRVDDAVSLADAYLEGDEEVKELYHYVKEHPELVRDNPALKILLNHERIP